jgi:hypothetical protein
MEHLKRSPNFDEIILNIMPLLKNGITVRVASSGLSRRAIAACSKIHSDRGLQFVRPGVLYFTMPVIDEVTRWRWSGRTDSRTSIINGDCHEGLVEREWIEGGGAAEDIGISRGPAITLTALCHTFLL